jgi:transcriptional regulator with XRE-family HTH domain
MGIENRIKIIRGKLSQKEFGKKISVSQSAVQLYEKGSIPKGDVLLSIHKEFGVDINWLLTGNSNTQLNEKDFRIDKAVTHLMKAVEILNELKE